MKTLSKMTNDKNRMTNSGHLRRSGLVLLALFCLMGATWAHEVHFGQTTVRVAGVEEAQWEALHSMLMDQLTLNGSGPAGEPLADDLAFFVRQHFIREGWPDAEVAWKMAKGGIELTVKPGNAVRVGTVTLKGELPLPVIPTTRNYPEMGGFRRIGSTHSAGLERGSQVK